MTDGNATESAPIVSVRDVGFRYPSGILALDGVSLDIATGTVVGIAGSNGAGKSTLARLLNGLLKPTSGTVVVDGRDTRRHDVRDLAGTVGVVFQHPRSQLFARTVADELAFGPRNLGLAPEAVDARVAATARRFGLDGTLATSPFALPAPLRRLVTIAAVVTMEPRVLVLDEPTTGQDHQTSALVVDLVGGLRDDGVAIVCISHDMRFLAAVSTRLVTMAAGRVVVDGTPSEVFAQASALAAAGLVAPQVTRLGAGLPARFGLPVVLTVDGLVAALRAGSPGGTGPE